MEVEIVENLYLNIGDKLKINSPNFYYKLEENKVFCTGYNQNVKDGWVHCPSFEGSYCGDRNYDNGGGLKIIKIRISQPITMQNFHGNYVEFYPSELDSIEILKKEKGTILDKISHRLHMDETLPKN